MFLFCNHYQRTVNTTLMLTHPFPFPPLVLDFNKLNKIIRNYLPKWRWIVVDIYRAAATFTTTFTDNEVNNCFSIYHTSWISSGPKSNFICDNTPTKAILFFVGCSEVNSTWLITSELANQRARKVLFTCVVYTKLQYLESKLDQP